MNKLPERPEERPDLPIVDGQQRLTTSVVFIACFLDQIDQNAITIKNEKPVLLRRNFIDDADDETRKFR